MQSKLKELKGLERKLSVTVPEDMIASKVESKFKELAKTAKLSGFRPGKVPLSVLKSRYGDGVFHDVVDHVIRETFSKAVQEKKLHLAGEPKLDVVDAKQGEPLKYDITFEVYPEFTLAELSKIKVSRNTAEVADKDITKVLENLKKQHATWDEVERAAKKGDRVELDYEGKIKGEALPNGKGEEVVIELGDGSLAPGFDEKIIGMKVGEHNEFKLKFPKENVNPDIAGKTANFEVKVRKVTSATLPDLDEALIKKLGFKEGKLDELKEQAKKSLTEQLDNAVKMHCREQLFEQLIKCNKIELPNALIDQEIHNMQHEAKQRIAMQTGQTDVSNMPDIPGKEFEEQARKRVTLGLLFSKLIEKYELKPDEARVREMIEKMAERYPGQKDQVISWYYNDKQRLAEIQSTVLEQQVVDKVMEEVKVSDKKVDFEQAMNWKQKD